MGGYIGARSGTLSTTVANVQDVTATDTTPEVTIINNTHEDTDGGREGKVIFKGQQSGGEESTLAEIEAHHSGSADDEKSNLIFRTNDGSDGASPTEAMRIESDQQVLITTSADAKGLTIKNSGNNRPYLNMDANRSGAGNNLAQMNFKWNGTDVARIIAVAGADTTNKDDAHITFGTASAGSVNEAMRITSDGYVGIGTSSPSYPLEISLGQSSATVRIARGNTSSSFKNIMLFRSSSAGADVGAINITDSATQYATSSDYRLKENVETLSNGITRVKQLQPKRFSWIVDETENANVDGFLAHEAQTVVPEAVTGIKDEVDDDGNAVIQGIDQAKLVPLLTAALQEAIAKIETLETKVAALEAE